MTGPVFTSEPISVDFAVSLGATIPCATHGDPKPIVDWFRIDKNGRETPLEPVPGKGGVQDQCVRIDKLIMGGPDHFGR